MAVPLTDIRKAGGKVEGIRGADRQIIDELACKLVGVLADAPTQEIRRKALEKARRMLGSR